MKVQVFEKRTRILAPAAAVFTWHERPQALRELIPPGVPVRVLNQSGGIHDGALAVLRLGYGIAGITWKARHEGYVQGVRFTDVQESGPFRFWRHTHHFIPDGDHSCVLHDYVEYALPFGVLTQWASSFVRNALEITFEYRHRVTFQAFC